MIRACSAPRRWRSTPLTSKPSIKSPTACQPSNVCRNDKLRLCKRHTANKLPLRLQATFQQDWFTLKADDVARQTASSCYSGIDARMTEANIISASNTIGTLMSTSALAPELFSRRHPNLAADFNEVQPWQTASRNWKTASLFSMSQNSRKTEILCRNYRVLWGFKTRILALSPYSSPPA